MSAEHCNSFENFTAHLPDRKRNTYRIANGIVLKLEMNNDKISIRENDINKLAMFTPVRRASLQQRLHLECGPMPNVIAALPNIGGALCSMPQSLADAQQWSAVE